MRKFVILAGGWALVAVGLVLTPAPVPIPLIGILPLLLGCAILSANSKWFRRGVQRLRHRFAFISHWLERFLHRAPRLVKVMIRRTRPLALVRRARIHAKARSGKVFGLLRTPSIVPGATPPGVLPTKCAEEAKT